MSRSYYGDNSSRTDEATKYRGVRKRKWGKYVSEIRLPNSRDRIWLGSYDSPEIAARAFDAASYCLRGSNATFNFPQDPPRFEITRPMSHEQILTAAQNYANSFSRGRRTTVQTQVQEDTESYWSDLEPLDTNTNSGWGGRNISSDFGGYDSGFYGGNHDDGYGGSGSGSSFPWGY